MSTSDITTARELRSQGLSFHKIARSVHRSIEYVKKACEDMPMPTKGINYRIGRFIGQHLSWTDQQIADKLGVHVTLITERRMKRKIGVSRNSPIPKKTDDIDRGLRMSPFVLRQICSKGQRTKWQLQAMTAASSCPMTMIEIVRSVEAAGLVIHKRNGLIHSPEVTPNAPLTH